MLFMFDGQIAVEDLETAMRLFPQYLQDNGLTHVREMHISLRGFSGDAECQIVDADELISQINFDLAEAADGAREPRMPRPGSLIRERPADMPWGGLGTFFNHND